MNKTTLIAVIATAYATAIAASFSLGFMLGPKQSFAGDGESGAITASAPALQGEPVAISAGRTPGTPNAMVASTF